MTILEEALEAGQRQQGTDGDVNKDLELLKAVLERARQVATRLEDDDADEELMARQCWQDRDDFSCASLCDLLERADSSDGGGDVGSLGDLANFSAASSPRRGRSPHSSRSGSPANSRSSSPSVLVQPPGTASPHTSGSQSSNSRAGASSNRNSFTGMFSRVLPRKSHLSRWVKASMQFQS